MKKRGDQKQRADVPEWERLLSSQMLFQAEFPECVLVGGTAAALHAKHRVSMDANYVLPDLKQQFADILRKVEEEAGWRTNRLEPPVLILGHFQGVRTGIRQLMRTEPLETTTVRGLRVPTSEEILRIKAYLIVRRNSTRDYIDFVALFDNLGVSRAMVALRSLDRLYPQEGGTTISQQLAIQLAEPKPWDLLEGLTSPPQQAKPVGSPPHARGARWSCSHGQARGNLLQTDLSKYKLLKPPYTDWNEVKRRALVAGKKLITDQI